MTNLFTVFYGVFLTLNMYKNSITVILENNCYDKCY